MMVSPASNCSASAFTVFSVASPAGTITQAARGLVSLDTKSSSDFDPVAPSLAKSATVCGAEVGDNALMAAPHQAAHHVAAHPAKPYHS